MALAALALLAALVGSLLLGQALDADSAARPASEQTGGVGSEGPQRVAEAYGRLPLRFEANRGQTDSEVDFIARGSGYSLFLTPRESVLSLSKAAKHGATKRAVLRTRLVNANPDPAAAAGDRLPGTTNYLRGKNPNSWQRGLTGFARVRYREVYPGIDLLYYGRQGKLEYDFRLAPGSDPKQIALDFNGARRLSLDRKGDLTLQTGAGAVRHKAPLAYQQIGGRRRMVASRFVLRRGNRVGLKLGDYDRSRPLVVDPVVVYSTYLGGLTSDAAEAIAVDGSGSAYITGITASPDFPTVNRFDGPPERGDSDAFITKLNPSGSALEYATYLGGAGFDEGHGIAVDSGGAAFVAGETASSDFPTSTTAFDKTCDSGVGCNRDGFIAKLAPGGSSLTYSAFLGGSGFDRSNAIAIDGSGSAYVAGETLSTNFPTTNALQPSYGGGFEDAFVAKVNPGATALSYSTYLGGSGSAFWESARGIAVNSSGEAYVTGQTTSGDFPTTSGAYDRSCGTDGGCNGDKPDAFVSKLSAAGSTLTYSTFLGGDQWDQAFDLALGHGGADSGSAYLVGETGSAGFPTTPGAYDRTCAGPNDGCSDAFVTKLNDTGSALDYSTLLGGSDVEANSGPEAEFDVAVDSAGGAYVTGRTDSSDFPSLKPVATSGLWRSQAFVSKLEPGGSGLSWSTRLGGNFQSAGAGIALDSAGAAYVTGQSSASDFPVTNALQPKNAGGAERFNAKDAFVAKLAPDDPQAPYVTGVRPDGDDVAGGRTVAITGTGFTGASGVRFGSAAAPAYTVVSDTEITATSPPNPAGAVFVTVTTAGRSSPPNPISRLVYGEGRWTSIDPLPLTVSPLNQRRPTATLLRSGKVLVAGGGPDRTGAALFDPKTGTWSVTGSLNQGREPQAAVLLQGGKVLIVGLSSAELYDPGSGRWTPTQGAPTLAQAATITATLLPNGKVLVVGGASAQLYDPASDSFIPANGPQHPRDQHTATLLPSGKVMVAGGREASAGDTAELYDEATGSWAETGRLRFSRFDHSATLLPGGKVLIAGGLGIDDSLRRSAELFDPSTGSSTLSYLDGPRRSHAATLLPNGKVLVTGGSWFGAVRTAELYDQNLTGGTGGWKSAGVMNAALDLPTATVLSSDPNGFASDSAVCGANCGKVLVVGSSQTTAAELYTPGPASSGAGGSPPSAGGSPPGPNVGPPAREPAPALPPFPDCPALTANVIRGSAAGNSIAGTPGADRIFAGTGDDTVNGLAGDDCINLGPGTDRGQGGTGRDLIVGGSGRDRLSGGTGRDRLSGGTGRDLIVGGSGRDRLSGGPGGDRIVARDGRRDRVNCGSGRDRVSADAIDRVAGNCERIVRRRSRGAGTQSSVGTAGLPALAARGLRRR